ncbi:Na+/H+ antiporter NhaA [Mycobacterium talmoniae]|nr:MULTISPECIES: Na+/H+ antiporter NhaA [Mycobacterium]
MNPSPHVIPLSASLRRRIEISKRFHGETLPAVALLIATVAAVVWANLSASYDGLWHTELGILAGPLHLALPLVEWVNEGLMAVFFFAIGLEVRREFAVGELRDREQAMLPVVAAVGGLVLPALLYMLVNWGTGAVTGWGVVISTDTAFALGVLALVGPKNAPRLRIFILTLAVVDDIAALLVIAGVYTNRLDLLALAVAAVALAGIWLLRHYRVWRVTPYLVVGVVAWVAVLESGIHATLAGVLVALLIPVYPPRDRDVAGATAFAHLYQQAPEARSARYARMSLAHAVPLNQRLSDLLAPYVNYVVVPVFALANAGVSLSGAGIRGSVTSTITWGVVLGLVVGKLIGIAGAAQLVMYFVPAARAPGLDFPRIAGVGAVSGIGFTISLLVADLAFADRVAKDDARTGVLLASLLAFSLAWLVFRLGERLKPLPTPAGVTLQRPIQRGRDHIRGHAAAATAIVVYAAMDDTYRKRTAVLLADVRRRMGDAVCVVFRHHTYDDDTATAALALEAAADQRRFWPMHDALVAHRGDLDEAALTDLAERTEVDARRFLHDVTAGVGLARIEDDDIDAAAAGLPDTPVLYLNGSRFEDTPNSLNVIWEARAQRS